MGLLDTENAGARTKPVTAEPIRRFEVFVLFTDIPATLAALRTAAQLSLGLTARIRLLLMEVVPYPLPLTEPPRNLRFIGRQFRTIVDDCPLETGSRSVETTAEIVLCRDAWKTLQDRLGRSAVIVIGKRSRWWPHAEDRLARRLRAAGHDVVRSSPNCASAAKTQIQGLSYV